MHKFEYYQKSFLPEIPELPINDNLTFKKISKEYNQYNEKKNAFFASYITEFDCKDNTNWWYTIKDDEYDISKLSSKKRYEITKAKKFCIAKIIDSVSFVDSIIECYIESVTAYDEMNRPKYFNIPQLMEELSNIIRSPNYRLYATFFKDNNKLIGFTYIKISGKFVKLVSHKTIPNYEKYNSSASLLDCILNDLNEGLRSKSIIITNGSRTIKHKTNFNDYLEKYFGFRKAYAKLKIVYRFPFGIIVFLLKPFGSILAKTNNAFLYNIYCVLKMDSFKEKKR